MKKVAMFVFALSLPLVIFFLMPAAIAMNLTEAHDGKVVTVDKGDTVTVTLKGNITTGYTWKVTNVSGKAVKQVGQVEYRRGGGNPNPGGPPVLGAPGTFEATFKAAEVGSSKVEMSYVGPGKNAPTAKTFSVEIQVK